MTVTSGQFTLQEAFKFSNFLKQQRRLIEDAEEQKKEELDREARRIAWAERYL